ncbi:MAG TPA: lamin tail domain-containing protein, partial [Puia sp.]|nr:lamin tail domain-containing protein [Puia sp.]
GICARSSAQPAHPFDIVIDELFPDPSPVLGLPEQEFLELKNVSSTSVDLRGWRITDGSATATVKLSFLLQPDSFVLICSTAAASLFSPFGSVIGVSGFPALSNDGKTIYLQSPEGLIIHSLAYDKSWYGNDIKSQGGWTLEMIDTHNPCAGASNWKASTDSRGGTPGKINSIDGVNRDQQGPVLLRTYTLDSLNIVAVFDEPLDSVSASDPSNYQLESIGFPQSANPIGPLFTEVRLQWSVRLEPRHVYHLTVSNSRDCAGNATGPGNIVPAGVPEATAANDLVINEILFNPPTNGYDYLELYNRSDKIIDAQHLYVSARDPAGALRSPVAVSSVPMLIFPGEFDVITENSRWVEQNYLVKQPGQLIELSSLPSLPDDQGDVVLLNEEGVIVDELAYDHKWHFALLDREDGIALERLDCNKPTQDPGNWTSAASTAGFGTPTYQNSERKTDQQLKGDITIEPRLFSPDHDGYEDFTYVNYKVPSTGYVANITLFDAAGRPVRWLAKNATLTTAGNFRWDGLDEFQHKLPTGIYIVLTEIYNLNGAVRKFKNTVTLVNVKR